MAIERSNPVPPGHYWVDVFDPKLSAFRDWFKRNRDSLRIVSAYQYPPMGSYEGRHWYLFEVLSPTPWEGPGFPTIANPTTQPDDTVQRPDPIQEPADRWWEFVKSGGEVIAREAAKPIGLALGIGGLLGAAYLFSKLKRR